MGRSRFASNVAASIVCPASPSKAEHEIAHILQAIDGSRPDCGRADKAAAPSAPLAVLANAPVSGAERDGASDHSRRAKHLGGAQNSANIVRIRHPIQKITREVRHRQSQHRPDVPQVQRLDLQARPLDARIAGSSGALKLARHRTTSGSMPDAAIASLSLSCAFSVTISRNFVRWPDSSKHPAPRATRRAKPCSASAAFLCLLFLDDPLWFFHRLSSFWRGFTPALSKRPDIARVFRLDAHKGR